MIGGECHLDSLSKLSSDAAEWNRRMNRSNRDGMARSPRWHFVFQSVDLGWKRFYMQATIQWLQSNGEENEENEEYAIFHLHPIYPAIHQPYRNQVRLSLVALLSITTWHSSQTPLPHAILHLHKA